MVEVVESFKVRYCLYFLGTICNDNSLYFVFSYLAFNNHFQVEMKTNMNSLTETVDCLIGIGTSVVLFKCP